MNPYNNLPTKALWKPSVSDKAVFDIDGLWDPKFDIQPTQDVITFGSCFARHLGNALTIKGFNWLVTEVPPQCLSSKIARLFNYNVFSARTGSILTASLLKQWVRWALGHSEVPTEAWQRNGRFYDPFRPRIEPNGFRSESAMKQSQAHTLKSFREGIEKACFFVFTLGSTECWISEEHGCEYPICPGAVVGDFDPEKHECRNRQFEDIRQDLVSAMEMMRKVNKDLKFILTVSSMPLAATKSDNHVLVATMETKSILRAVAGQLARHRAYVDYFPSYEMINSPVFRGSFFESNLRRIRPQGMSFVMNGFFNGLATKYGADQGADGKGRE